MSWSKALVRKWINIKKKAFDFHSDDLEEEGCGGEWSIGLAERDAFTAKKSRTERFYKKNPYLTLPGKIDLESIPVKNVLDYRIFVGTWNVGGRSPPSYLNLEDWLNSSNPADIYVLGFQEVVPLNAGNVLGIEDGGPAKKWMSLIGKTLNNPFHSICNGSCQTPSPAPDPIVELNADFEGSAAKLGNTSFFHRRSFQSLRSARFSDEEIVGVDSPNDMFYSPMSYDVHSSLEDKDKSSRSSRYCLVASEQMVGIFLTVWVRSEIRENVNNLKVSCIGRGLMGYLGNKGSISISMSVHQTTFCFICSHLTSGQKEGDELRMNSDVLEILRKTRFPRVHAQGNKKNPETILEHDRVIWLGDLNYRIALSYRYAKILVEMHNWRALLEKDQLRMEQSCGRVFVGWNEGQIYFPPTYKYSNNSDRFSGDDLNPKEKRRTPAWCDRILWRGTGLNQLSYVRGESRFSDHRPPANV